MSPENGPEQDVRAARLDELLARADQAAQRIVAQQAERYASSEYAARMELEAQAQAEAGQQAQARDDVELELLRCCLSTLPDEPVDQVVHQGYRLRLAPARKARTRPARFAVVNAKNRPPRSASTARVRILSVANLSPVRLALISLAAAGFSTNKTASCRSDVVRSARLGCTLPEPNYGTSGRW